jgi:hypothetical protein
VLRLSIEDIERRTDLDTETIEDVMAVLKQEFEEDPIAQKPQTTLETEEQE